MYVRMAIVMIHDTVDIRSFLVGDKIQITKHENFRVLSGVSESTIVVATNHELPSWLALWKM